MGDYLKTENDNVVRGYNNYIDNYEKKAVEGLYSVDGDKRENSLATYIAVQNIKKIINDHGDYMADKDCKKLLGESSIKNYAKEIQNSAAFKDIAETTTSLDYDEIYVNYKNHKSGLLNDKVIDYNESNLEKAKAPDYKLLSEQEKQKQDVAKAKAKAEMDKKNAEREKKEAEEAQKKAKQKAADDKAKKKAEEKAAKAKAKAEKKAEKERIKQEKAEAKRKAKEAKAEAKRKAAEEKAKAKAAKKAEKEKIKREKAEAKQKAKEAKAEAKRKAKEAKEAPKKQVEAQKKPVDSPVQKIEDRHKHCVGDIISKNGLRDTTRLAQLLAEEQIHRDLLAKNDGTLTLNQISAGLNSNNIYQQGQQLGETDKFQQYYDSLSPEQIQDYFKNPDKVGKAYDSYQSFVPVKKEAAPAKAPSAEQPSEPTEYADVRSNQEKAMDYVDQHIRDYQTDIQIGLENNNKAQYEKGLAGVFAGLSMKEFVKQNGENISQQGIDECEGDTVIEEKINDLMKGDAFKSLTSKMKSEDYERVAEDGSYAEAEKHMSRLTKQNQQREAQQEVAEKKAAPKRKSM